VKTSCFFFFVMSSAILVSTTDAQTLPDAIPIRIEASIGWNQFALSGIESDMQIEGRYLPNFHVPLEEFGQGVNLSLIILTPAWKDFNVGVGIAYFSTSASHYNGDSTLSTELEYVFTGLSPAFVVEYSRKCSFFLPFDAALRAYVGGSFVMLRKDHHFTSYSFPPLPGYAHVKNTYSTFNPEIGVQFDLMFNILSNMRVVPAIGWWYSPSKDIEGNVGPPSLAQNSSLPALQ
jgi:hypothetical protein